MMRFTIESLRQGGNKVRVQHRRAFRCCEELLTRGQFEEWNQNVEGNSHSYQKEVLPKGGETMVQITTQDKQELVGFARCSKLDAYNRKKGVIIALGRAMTTHSG